MRGWCRAEPAFRVVGLMSGSSHDGMDLSLVRFQLIEGRWRYEVLYAETLSYPPFLESLLRQAVSLSGQELLWLSISYTDWTAQVLGHRLRPYVYDLVSWHGPTVFHQPERGLSWALGDAERLRAKVGKPVVTHFRAVDLALGGEGAPLIPHADMYLWPEYETLLNLGGIANVTHLPGRRAFDISPCNQLLNALARQLESRLTYDPEGAFARKGRLIPALWEAFFSAPIFHTPDWPAISNEIVATQFLAPFLAYPAAPADKLHTATCAIAAKIGEALRQLGCQQVYLTGGGTHNTYLVEVIQCASPCPCLPAPQELIDFREAIGFAFLGLRRYLGEDNLQKAWTKAPVSQGSGLISQ